MSVLTQLTPKSLPEFSYVAPESIQDAISILSQFGPRARIIAGGSDLLYLLKRDASSTKPEVIVDVKKINELNHLTFDGALKIGATMTLNQIEHSRIVLDHYPTLAQAASVIGSPQIRNVSTVGGSLCQQVWCWFLREGLKCWRSAGQTCYAIVQGADNRYYHSVMGGRECYAVHPSDLATAAKVFDPKITIVGPKGKRTVSFDDFLPGNVWISDVLQSHVLKSNEILTEIEFPIQKPETHGVYLRAAIRGVFDFPIVSLAMNLTLDGSTIDTARVVFGSVAPTPFRDYNVENVLEGQRLTKNLREAAATSALRGATPLENNAYKIEIAKGLVRKAVTTLSARKTLPK